MSIEQSAALKTALKAADSASKVIQNFAQQGFDQETKIVGDTELGLVTKADLEAEKCIVDCIKSDFPDHAFLAEESLADTQIAQHLWIIDPIDGTNNFAHGIPHYSASIAYYVDGIAQCGVVANPATGEVFWTEKGRGAWLGDRQVHVSKEASLNEAIIATGFYYDRGQMMKETLQSIEKLFDANIRGIRRFGSAALDLAYVGCGRYSAFFEYQLFPWDFAAGKLFVQEAGGITTNCYGDDIPLQSTTMLATNGLIHEQALQIVGLAKG
jgi:myo-inositol-1(or 4)-monophosphatase